jgi:hypothetical protein
LVDARVYSKFYNLTPKKSFPTAPIDAEVKWALDDDGFWRQTFLSTGISGSVKSALSLVLGYQYPIWFYRYQRALAMKSGSMSDEQLMYLLVGALLPFVRDPGHTVQVLQDTEKVWSKPLSRSASTL